MPIKIVTHNDKRCYFNSKDHKYFVKDQSLTPVTTFVDGFFPEFEREKVATKYAAKHGLTKDIVLSNWDKNAEKSRFEGTMLHGYAEHSIDPTWGKDVPQIPNILTPKSQSIDRAITELRKKYELIAAEMIVFSIEFGLAGTIDLLMRDVTKNEILILDWKTNKKIEFFSPWRNALPPLDGFTDCNGVKYALQLNTYERILYEENYFPDISKYKKALIHITPEKHIYYKLEDMQEEVKEMIEWI